MLAGFAGSFPLSVMLGWLGRRHALKVMTGLIVLPSVPLALAGGDHRDFVGARAAILALQLDSLGARFVVDTPPLLGAPPAPVLGSVASANPVGEHRQRQALTSTDQLLQGADAGALAIRDILGGTQFPAAHLNPSCRKQKRKCIRGKKQTDISFQVICNDKNNMLMLANCQLGSGHRDTFMDIFRLHGYK